METCPKGSAGPARPRIIVTGGGGALCRDLLAAPKRPANDPVVVIDLYQTLICDRRHGGTYACPEVESTGKAVVVNRYEKLLLEQILSRIESGEVLGREERQRLSQLVHKRARELRARAIEEAIRPAREGERDERGQDRGQADRTNERLAAA